MELPIHSDAQTLPKSLVVFTAELLLYAKL